MTNKEAIERIKDHCEIHFKFEPESIMITEALNMTIKALEQQEKDRWIPVSEGLPKEDGDYLCSFEFEGRRWVSIKPYGLTKHQESTQNGITQKYIDLPVRRYFYEPYYNRELENVVAWKPLPEVYKGG